ncbi:uncharacterized protein YoxC [Bradyrhizobium sp. USDA 4501]
MRGLGSLLAAGTIALSLGVTMPARALIVFDPNNYVQNVLTAARELQQINNQITSLQNEAQMLINQAKNLANLPYSSLQQLQSSIQRTQQLLAQAQRIAYDVQQIDRAFSTSYAPATSSQSSQLLISNAPIAMAEFLCSDARRASCPGRHRWQPRQQSHPDVCPRNVEPECQRHPAGNTGRQPDPRTSSATTCRSHGGRRGAGQGAEP